MTQSVTVSFRCRGELKEWLESYAEERMMTTSLAAQQIISERYREEESGDREVDESEPDLREDEENPREAGEVEPRENRVLEAYDEHWYRPRSQKHDYAVEIPDAERPKYYKTARGAAKRLEEEYGELGEE